MIAVTKSIKVHTRKKSMLHLSFLISSLLYYHQTLTHTRKTAFAVFRFHYAIFLYEVFEKVLPFYKALTSPVHQIHLRILQR